LLPAISPTDPQTDEFSQRLAVAGKALEQARVEAIYCVHGTFSGNDALGLLTELGRFAPGLSRTLSRLGKRTVDLVVGETGNYTPQFVAALEAGLRAGTSTTIPVRQFNWSSQNNHIARADGAVRLIYELATVASGMPAAVLQEAVQPRVLLWGHSHGGNVFSLLTSLLAAERDARDAFFYAARSFYRPWLGREVDLPVWQQVRELLDLPDHPLRRLKLDIVTFGTPVRYGWDADGYAQLLHFVHHRPPENGAEFLAPWRIHVCRLLAATDGDYVQQIGISGTNFAPVPFAPRTLLADWRLDRFLEQDLPRERLVTRLSHGKRVPDAGTTLLVDYGELPTRVYQHLAGHAHYTRRRWLPFHCDQIVERFYGVER